MSKALKAAFLVVLLPIVALLYAVAQAEPQFQDEFNTPGLGAGWTTWDGYALQHPSDTGNHAAIQSTGSQLSISFPGGMEHNQWLLKHAQITRPHLGSGVYEIKVDSAMTGDQQFGLAFEQNAGTFMHFMLYSNANDRVYAYVERFALVNGQQHRATVYGQELPLAVPSAGPHRIRVVLIDNANPANRTWKFDWSPDGSTWIEIMSGVLETNLPEENMGTIQRVGLFAGNQPTGFHAFDAKFDYFRYYNSLANVPLSKPGNLRASAGNQKVDLAWDAVSLASSYNVYSVPSSGSPTLLGTTTQLTFAQSGLTNGTTYRYAVAAVRAGVEGPSAEVSAVPHVNGLATLPAQGLVLALGASELAYTQASGSAVSTWPNAAGPSIAATSIGSQTPTLIHSAINGQAAVRFDGVDDHLTLPSGFQDFTAGMSLYVVKRPSVLTPGFKIVALGNGAGQHNIVLGRAGSTSGLQYFTTNAGGEYAWFNTPSGLAAGEASLVSVLQDGGSAGSLALAEVAKNGVALFAQQVFVPPVTVRSVNYIGKSYWADGMFQGDIAEIVLYNRKLTAQEHANVQTYIANKYGLSLGGSTPSLGAPGGVGATAGNGSVALSWSAVDGATGYRVLRSTTSGGPYTQVASPAGTSHSDSGLTNGTAYYYVVRAFNASLESVNSSQVSATPNQASLAAPTGVGATAGNGSVVLSWSAVSGATGYRVLRGTISGGPYTQVASPAGTSHSDSGLTNGTAYYYVVRAFNASLESPNSQQVSATPVVPLPEPNPALPASGRFLVLDAQTAALQFANGAAVTAWQDISGNARHAAASGSTTPVLVTNAINGQPVLRFDGVDDHLTLPSGFQDFTAGMSLYVVKRPSVLTPGFKIVALGNGAGQHNIVLGRAGSTSGLQYFTTNAGGEYAWFNTPSGLAAGEASLVSVLQDGGSAGSLALAEVAKNGVALFAQQVFVPPVTVRSINYIARSYWAEGMFQGDIAEIVLYNRKLTAQEHANVKAYLAGKYGLSVN
jgi:fibronectin type 3 domain-containing protein